MCACVTIQINPQLSGGRPISFLHFTFKELNSLSDLLQCNARNKNGCINKIIISVGTRNLRVPSCIRDLINNQYTLGLCHAFSDTAGFRAFMCVTSDEARSWSKSGELIAMRVDDYICFLLQLTKNATFPIFPYRSTGYLD